MNLAERAITSARAAELTADVREKVSAAMEAPEGERETLLTEALAAAVEALDALTELLLDARAEALQAEVDRRETAAWSPPWWSRLLFWLRNLW